MANVIDDFAVGVRAAGLDLFRKQSDEVLASIAKSINVKSTLDDAAHAGIKGSDDSLLKGMRNELADVTGESLLKRLTSVDSALANQADTITDLKSAISKINTNPGKIKLTKMDIAKKIFSIKTIFLVAAIGAGLYIVISGALNCGSYNFTIEKIEPYQDFTGKAGDVRITVKPGFAFYDGSVRSVPADTITFFNTPDYTLNQTPCSVTCVMNQYSFIVNVGTNISGSLEQSQSSSAPWGTCVLFRSYAASMALQGIQVIGFGSVMFNTLVKVGINGVVQIVDGLFNSSDGALNPLLDTVGDAVNQALNLAGDTLTNLLDGFAGLASDIAAQLAAAAAAAAKAAAGAGGGLLSGIGNSFIYIVIAIVGIIIFLNMTKKKA